MRVDDLDAVDVSGETGENVTGARMADDGRSLGPQLGEGVRSQHLEGLEGHVMTAELLQVEGHGLHQGQPDQPSQPGPHRPSGSDDGNHSSGRHCEQPHVGNQVDDPHDGREVERRMNRTCDSGEPRHDLVCRRFGHTRSSLSTLSRSSPVTPSAPTGTRVPSVTR